MRTFSAAILATTLLVSSAFAADNAPTPAAPLAPGKPAGVKNAQGMAPWIGPVVLGGVLIGVIVYAATYKDNNYPSNTGGH